MQIRHFRKGKELERSGNEYFYKVLYSKLAGQLNTVKGVDISIKEAYHGVAPLLKHVEVNSFDVYYEDRAHVYFYATDFGRIPVISVTTLIGLFEQEFDEEGMSWRCAMKDSYEASCLDKTGWFALDTYDRQDRIKLAWKTNNGMSTDYGTAAHMLLEYLAVYGDFNKIDDYLVQVLARTPEWVHQHGPYKEFANNMVPILEWYKSHGWECIAEPLLVDPILGAAGQSDLVMVHHKNKEIWVLDYKTNKEKPQANMKSYGKMKEQFSKLEDHAYNHYSIQLSLYANMLLQMYPGYSIKGLTLLWLNRETGSIEAVPVEFDKWNPLVSGVRSELITDGTITRVYKSLIQDLC